jgi:hypothetical protein
MSFKVFAAAVAAMTVAFSGTGALAAVNFLTNPGFEATPNAATSASFQLGGGTSAAPGWELYNNNSATTSSSVIASTLPGGGDQMLHIVTGGHQNGVYQYFSPFAQFAQVRVFVNSGAVALYLYENGNTERGKVVSSATNVWQTLTLNTGSVNANEIVIYSEGASADFFVDNAYAGAAPLAAVPEPASWALMILGFGAAGAAIRRRRTGPTLA